MPKIDANITVTDTICSESVPSNCGIVIFGASGDLVRRKLLPALFGLYVRKLLPEKFYILGFARTEMPDDAFRELVSEAVLSVHGEQHRGLLTEFLAMCRYVAGDYNDLSAYDQLSTRCSMCDKDFDSSGNRLFYLALPPQLHPAVVRRLSEAGLTNEGRNEEPWARVIFEKPFGHDLASALHLDDELQAVLAPQQIFRMDHYLGKETLQSILMFRFANAIFEPLWNRRYIDHVQITVAESVGVEHRGSYYDGAGCLRDMFQNHMLQILALVAMEPPISFQADAVRDERVKLMRSIRPWPEKLLHKWIIRGQYQAGNANGKNVAGYREEPSVAPDSITETYVAAKVLIDNWRWQGVPFFIRTGKRMPKKVSEIAVTFKRVPYSMFGMTSKNQMPANVLVFRIQPDEGIDLSIQAKQPGPKSCMSSMSMSFDYRDVFNVTPPDAYERLLLDCMQGDRTLFWSREGVTTAWELIDPVLEHWEQHPERSPLHPYEAGSWGPEAAEGLIQSANRRWRKPPENFRTHLLGNNNI